MIWGSREEAEMCSTRMSRLCVRPHCVYGYIGSHCVYNSIPFMGHLSQLGILENQQFAVSYREKARRRSPFA